MNKNDMMAYLHTCWENSENSAGVCAYSKEDIAALERQSIPKSILDRGRIPYSSLGNTKTNSVHKGGGVIATFSIPRHPKICVGATRECFRRCYAIKASKQYSNTRLARSVNYLLTFDPLFEQNMIISIKELQAKLGSRLVGYRIHESGELYSQQYLNAWIQIARSIPRLRFACYTKANGLNFSSVPQNMVILRSIDVSTKKENVIPQYGDSTPYPSRYAISGSEDTFEGYKRENIPAEFSPNMRKENVFDCPKHCADCLFCYSSRTWPYKHVYFQWH